MITIRGFFFSNVWQRGYRIEKDKVYNVMYSTEEYLPGYPCKIIIIPFELKEQTDNHE